MTQPPLSRAIKQLETDLGAILLERSPSGVALTPAGTALYDEARTLLAGADQVRARVAAAAGPGTLRLGTLADSSEPVGIRLAGEFRERHPGVRISVREADLTDPTTGLRAGLVDVALTRIPFDTTGIRTRVLRSDPMGVVLRADDPLAGRAEVRREELADRAWFRFPDGTDPQWQAFWSGGGTGGPVVRTVHECLQAVLWNGTVGLAPLAHSFPEGVTTVPLAGCPPSRLVVAWREDSAPPLVRSFVELAVRIAGLDGRETPANP